MLLFIAYAATDPKEYLCLESASCNHFDPVLFHGAAEVPIISLTFRAST